MDRVIIELRDILIVSSKFIDKTSIKGHEIDPHTPTKIDTIKIINSISRIGIPQIQSTLGMKVKI